MNTANFKMVKNKSLGDPPRPWLTGDSVLGDISAGEPEKERKKNDAQAH